jgi:hypothetical protein
VVKLSPFSLGISEIEETYRFGKRRYKATTYMIFKLTRAEVLELHKVEVRTTE